MSCSAVLAPTTNVPLPDPEVEASRAAFHVAVPTVSSRYAATCGVISTLNSRLTSLTASSACGVGVMLSEAVSLSPFGAVTV
ncbi:hypothetical protein D3C75_978840 [compost metagenome]